MRLSDIMGNAGLAFWPQVALIIFLLVFFAVTIRVYTRPRSVFAAQAQLPFDDCSDSEPGATTAHS
jgi:hypothetical protein